MGYSTAKIELLLTYVGALGLSTIKVLTDKSGTPPCRLALETEPELIEHDGTDAMFDTFWFAKAHHAELVLTNCRDDLLAVGAARGDGMIDLAAHTVRDYVINVSSGLGAEWRTTSQIVESAEENIREIEQHINAWNQAGGLSAFNAAYKRYREQCLSSTVPAIGYSAYLHRFKLKVADLVGKNVAAGADKFSGIASLRPDPPPEIASRRESGDPVKVKIS